MFNILVSLAYIIACYKWGDWRNWAKYYSTILYVIIGDLAYNFIFYNHSLWTYNGVVNHTFNDILTAFIIYPCAVILYLTLFPKKISNQILYIIGWTGINTLIEFILFKQGFFVYENGWNILFSAALYLLAFILVRFHYKKPLIVWPISGAFGLITMYLFNWSVMKLK